MADVIGHRGPDGEGFWINDEKTVGFGFRRLAILDLSANGDQPMSYADGRFTIIFNGEIYNYIEIRRELENKGYKFKSGSDTEVLLANFQEKGAACVNDFDGMFAFAIWDEKTRKLFCARDRFGEKPFFYAVYEGALYFASEMKSLWSNGIPRIVGEKMLFEFLAKNRLQNPHDLSETFFENIYKLKAAHYFFASPENLEIEQKNYWKIDVQNVNRKISENEACERFRELFDESVSRRLRSDVAVGSSLSGGLDSSLIVCTIDELKKGRNIPQSTFSARFPGFAKDEGKFMQFVIDKTLVEPHFVFPDENGFAADLDTLFYFQEEPFNHASIYAQFSVFRLAKEKNVTVLLDGQGADELLAGYPPYFFDYFSELKKRDKPLWKTETDAHSRNYSGSGKIEKIKNLLKYNLPENVKTKFGRTKEKQEFSNYLNKDFIAANLQNDFSAENEKPQTLAESLYKSTFGGDLENLLRYADRNSMANSREVRLPFSSHKLAEFIFALPPEFKIKNGVTKYILRKSFARRMPSEIVERKDKIGYEPPQNRWLEMPKIREEIGDAISFLTGNTMLRSGALENFKVSRDEKTLWKILMAKKVLEKK